MKSINRLQQKLNARHKKREISGRIYKNLGNVEDTVLKSIRKERAKVMRTYNIG